MRSPECGSRVLTMHLTVNKNSYFRPWVNKTCILQRYCRPYASGKINIALLLLYTALFFIFRGSGLSDVEVFCISDDDLQYLTRYQTVHM